MIATILLLALTVTLFASIFFFVNTFPAPPPQENNQFTSTLSYSGTTIATVQISHLAGPQIPGTDLVYITSAANPGKNPPAFTVSSGIGGAASWTLGEQWTKNIFSYGLTTPDNLTVSVVSATQLVYRTILPGSNPNVPPTFENLLITPTNPQVGQSFTVSTQILSSSLNMNSVYVNYSQLPGATGLGRVAMTYSASTGLWSYTFPSGLTTAAGTFYLFLNASGNGLANSAVVSVTLGSTNAPVTISLTASPSTIVANSAVSLLAPVTNLATGAASATVTFTAGATTVSTQTSSVPAGSTSTFIASWTPSTVGVYNLGAQVQISGGVTVSAHLNVTVFPAILLVAHNVPSGTVAPDNSSAYLGQELTSDGFPFTSKFVSCSSALSSAMFTGYGVAIVDFGSTWTGGCPKSASTTDESAITGAASTSFWVVGSNAFGVAPCNSYNSAFYSLVGAKFTAGSTCVTLPNATGTPTYTGTPASGLRSDGIPSTMTVNKTIAGVSTYVPLDEFSLGATNTAYITVGGKAVGTFAVGASTRDAALAADPSMFAAALPNGNNWGTGIGGASIAYNVVNFLSGLSNASSPGRALNDFAVAQSTIVGVNHATPSTIYAALRTNGPNAGGVTATLYVNGTVAQRSGVPVTATATVSGNGAFVFVTLTWQAPSSGRYTLAIGVVVAGQFDYYSVDDQLGFSVMNQATNFA